MPNNPLPTPTPPNSPKTPLTMSGQVPQGAAPKTAPTATPKQVAPTGKPAASAIKPPTSTAPANQMATSNNAAAPTTVVTPGQIKPPVVQSKPAATPNQVAVQQTKPGMPLPKPATAAPTQAQVQPARPAQPSSQPSIKPNPTTQPTPTGTTSASQANSKSVQASQPTQTNQPAQAAPSAVQPKPTLTVQPAAVQQPPARPASVGAPAITPPSAGLPKPGQATVKPVSPAVASAAPVTVATNAQQPATAPAAAAPAVAVKKPPVALFAVIGLVVLGLVGFLLYSMFGQPKSQPTNSAQTGNNQAQQQSGTKTGESSPQQKVSPDKQTIITYWGLWEPTEILGQVIADFETANPQYKIDYRKQSHRDYRERLQTAIASGNGPDIFRFHASWTPMLQNELSPMPNSVMSDAEYKKVFYPIAAQQLAVKGRIVGIPLMYDGLALFYNADILKTANAEPPQNWAELRSLADALTSPSDKTARGSAPLQRSGLAIGNAENVEHFSDILGLLILQNGGDLSQPNSAEVRDALLFYTNFVKEDMVWSEALPSSTVAFARGDTAMMLAPSWRAHDVKNLNPDLNFGIAPAPKLGDTRLGWATYWAEGVNVKSKNQEGAWAFLKYLSTPAVLQKFYADASQVRSFGEIYPRQDMAAELNDDAVVSQFLVDAPTAEGWYLSSYTHDNGINDQLIKYYKDAVNSILEGKSVDEVVETLEAGTVQVLRQYNAEN